MKFILLSKTSTTYLAGNSFAQPYIADRDTAVASVEPETGRQDDSRAIVMDVHAGVEWGFEFKDTRNLNGMVAVRNASFVFVHLV